jgi:Co/Zn/Cd efflux system component
MRLTDLHVWRVGRGKYARVVSLVTTARADAQFFRQALRVHEELVHVTVEVTHWPDPIGEIV